MRPLGVVGILFIILGVLVLVGEWTFPSRRDVLQVGDVKVTVAGRQSFPPWASGLAILAGVALVVSGTRQRMAKHA